MIVAALAAVLLVLALSATPAFAQGGDQGPVAGDDAVQAGDNIQYGAVCQNILGSVDATVIAEAIADQDVVAGNDAAAAQEIAAEAGVSVEQVNECLNGVANPPVDTINGGGTTTRDITVTPNGDKVLTVTIPEQKVLAATGGPSLLLPALGLLLVAGGAAALRTLLRR